MISGLLVVNAKGELLIQRMYRDDVRKSAIEAFRHEVIEGKNAGVPVVHVDDTSFLYSRQGDVFVVAITNRNANCTMVFQFIYNLVDVFKAYFGGAFEEERIRENFVLIYELLDETLDYGYPQITAVTLLQGFIKVGDVKTDPNSLLISTTDAITSEITGAVDWRQPGKFKYRKNEVYIDVLEAVNLLMSSKGTVLRCDVSGKIMMKAYLTGMPECKFGMNDKLVMDKEAAKGGTRRSGSGIAIDDVTFHRCVRLGQFDQDRTISFIPPDGEFELMKYRITQAAQPFKVIPLVTEHGRSRVEFEIKVKSNFPGIANNVLLKIPCPHNTAKVKLSTTGGSAKYYPEHSAIIWSIKKYPGETAYTLKGEARLLVSLNDKPWSRPPIDMEFQVPMFTASGLHVRFLKVFERNNYQTIKWVRYITRGGSYQIRI